MPLWESERVVEQEKAFLVQKELQLGPIVLSLILLK